MTRPFARLFLLLAASLLLQLQAAAQTPSAEHTTAMRAVIEAQLAAFAADDAARAFSYAAPGIREVFGTPDRFLAMVRSGYPVVYRPASVTFLAGLSTPSGMGCPVSTDARPTGERPVSVA